MNNRRIRPSINKIALVTNDLTWDVDTHAVISNGTTHADYKALHRNDDGHLLNIVKKGYNVLSNESLKGIVHQLHEFSGFPIMGYSQWDQGGKVFAFLKNEEKIKIGGWESEQYMIVGNSHDKSMSFFTGTSGTLIRCKNAFSQINQHHRVKHRAGMDTKIQEIIYLYESYMEDQRKLTEKFEEWNGIMITADLKKQFVEDVLTANKDGKVSSIKENQRKDLLASVITECNAMGDSMFGLFNGVTHYTTHKISRDKTFGNVFGHGAKLNKQAFAIVSSY